MSLFSHSLCSFYKPIQKKGIYVDLPCNLCVSYWNQITIIIISLRSKEVCCEEIHKFLYGHVFTCVGICVTFTASHLIIALFHVNEVNRQISWPRYGAWILELASEAACRTFVTVRHVIPKYKGPVTLSVERRQGKQLRYYLN